MTQGEFDFGPDQELDRVALRIEATVYEFLVMRLRSDRQRFHMEELLDYVSRVHSIKLGSLATGPGRRGGRVAPASPDRILRYMRQKGVARYIVLDRSRSLYQITALAPERKSA